MAPCVACSLHLCLRYAPLSVSYIPSRYAPSFVRRMPWQSCIELRFEFDDARFAWRPKHQNNTSKGNLKESKAGSCEAYLEYANGFPTRLSFKFGGSE